MGLEIVEPNACIRGCCNSNSIPLHLPPSSYSILSPIARGAESVVYEGILDGRRVAVKKPVLSTSQDIDNFHKQLQILWSLSFSSLHTPAICYYSCLHLVDYCDKCRRVYVCISRGYVCLELANDYNNCSTVDHPGIARLVAAHAKPPNYMFFFEYYESGNLSTKLHVQEWNPSFSEVLVITVHLAKALQYLHSQGIVHRDVKPANVLLDQNLHPHLGDFGLAEYKKNLRVHSVDNWKSSGKPTGGFHKKNMVGTLIYMAPEILRKEIHTEKSDVYSFGIFINELLTGVVPYTDQRAEAQAHTVLEMNYTEQQLTAAVVSSKLRPTLAPLGSAAPASMLSLIEKCWDDNPQNRPSFNDIITELGPMLYHRNKSTEENLGLGKSSIEYDNLFMGAGNNNLAYKKSIDWSTEGERLSKRASLAVHSSLRIWCDSSNSMAYLPVLSWGSFATCGNRETMEDTHFLMPHFCNEKDVHLFGIFDGHRGAAAAEFSAKALPSYLKSIGSTSSPADALFEAFVSTDEAFRNAVDTNCKPSGVIQKDWHPGCTAVATLIVKNKLFVANAGDCRTILCRAGQPIPLTKDHVASCLEERNRIVSAGEKVKWQVDTWRIGSAGLQVTRSIGDGDLKPAVTAEPEITETKFSAEDEFLVMASDGLWDVVSNAEVVSIIQDTVKEPAMCSKRLATEAAERGSKDNITVIVVFLQPVSTVERIY